MEERLTCKPAQRQGKQHSECELCREKGEHLGGSKLFVTKAGTRFWSLLSCCVPNRLMAAVGLFRADAECPATKDAAMSPLALPERCLALPSGGRVNAYSIS